MRATGARKSAQLLCAITFALSPISFSSAQAESNTQISPAPDNYKQAMDQYRVNRDLYISAMRVRNEQIRAINLQFKSACENALTDFKTAMSQARTPDQKNLAIAARKSAVSAAIVARDLAITALGAEPTPPLEPTKPQKAKGKKKSR
jgi:hypothetical protein